MQAIEQQEFAGSEWEQGYCLGADGRGWLAAIGTIRRELERDLTAAERRSFAKGWLVGTAERADWLRDQEQMDDNAMRGEIALALPL
jgi:hypothetical protein